ncbi:hypothetical protein LT330_005930 [Penicillium expansum]|nr:hypothetical protein LT330_005930 [Penicillium expansum]
MSDSEVPAPTRATGKRTVNGLTASQIQHKRDLDRKAQRALRQRTKLRIQELESDIARFRASFSQREQTMIDEVQLLRDQNRKLKCSLENIRKYALGELSNLGETSLPQDTPDGETAEKETEQFPEPSLRLGEGTLETQPILAHQPFQSDHDTSNKVEINEIPIPEPGENDILIKNACASLCHSDLMLFWGHTAEKPPMEKVTIGHENTGTVAAIGRNVTGFKIGDPVGCLGCSYACYDCEGCRVHNLHCVKGTGRLHGFTTHGHFAEYSLSDYRNAMVLPAGMDLATTAPLFCAGITAYHSVKKCGLNEGDWITIIGCGGLGHLAIQYAKALKLRVIGIDISDSQLESAKSLGADLTFNSASTLGYEKEILSQTDGGAHAAVVLSASNAAYQSAPSVLRINGILMVIGIPKENLSINALHILLGKYRIMGASSGTPQQMREPIEFSHKHGIKAHMTTFNDIEDIQKIIDLLENGKTAGRFGIVF